MPLLFIRNCVENTCLKVEEKKNLSGRSFWKWHGTKKRNRKAKGSNLWWYRKYLLFIQEPLLHWCYSLLEPFNYPTVVDCERLPIYNWMERDKYALAKAHFSTRMGFEPSTIGLRVSCINLYYYHDTLY